MPSCAVAVWRALRSGCAAGELRPGLRPPNGAPHCGRHARGGAPAAGGVQPRAWCPPRPWRTHAGSLSLVREGGAEGLPGVRAIGVELHRGPAAGGERRTRIVSGAQRPIAQVSMNVERPTETPLRRVVEVVRRHAAVACAELVGLAPAAAWEGFPEDLPVPGFDPARHVIENAPPRLGTERPPRRRNAPARERTRLSGMAQTKRKTKHRGNAAGMVESRGRTGRRPTAAERSGSAREKAKAKEQRLNKYDRPPTWRGAFYRAAVAAVADAADRHRPDQELQRGDRAVPDRARGRTCRSATTPTRGSTSAACARRPRRGAR